MMTDLSGQVRAAPWGRLHLASAGNELTAAGAFDRLATPATVTPRRSEAMPRYLVIHHAPGISQEDFQRNVPEVLASKYAKFEQTYVNIASGTVVNIYEGESEADSQTANLQRTVHRGVAHCPVPHCPVGSEGNQA